MSVVRSVLERVHIVEGFLKRKYIRIFGTLETVRNREVSVSDSFPYREVRLYYEKLEGNFFQDIVTI